MLELPRRGSSNEYPQSMFWSKNKKNRYTPVYPSFAIKKWGIRGYILHRHVFLMPDRSVFGRGWWPSGRVSDSKSRGSGSKSHWCHAVTLSKAHLFAFSSG